jgi:hypothetical protein
MVARAGVRDDERSRLKANQWQGWQGVRDDERVEIERAAQRGAIEK